MNLAEARNAAVKNYKWKLRIEEEKPLTKPELQNEKSATSDGFTFVVYFHKNNELVRQIFHKTESFRTFSLWRTLVLLISVHVKE